MSDPPAVDAEQQVPRQLHLLGVRHHGPGSARAVVQTLEAVQPAVVLVELPADLQSALPWVGTDGLVPPVALLGYAVADPARAVFAPFGVFSPEWQAIQWANEHGVEVRAIDLPLAVTLALVAGRGRADGQDQERVQEHVDELEDELVGERSPPDPLRDLAAAAGDPDPERWWEDVIEHRGDGPAAFEAVGEAMAAVRSGFIPGRRELQREAHMRRAIRVACREFDGPVAVVCGAWHVPVLDVGADRSPSAASDTSELRGLPKLKVASAWVPWTHRRLAVMSGYSAGVESPGWYRHVYEHPGPDGVARFFVEIARLLRTAGIGASPDDLIAGTRLATALATLRGRPRAGLSEVLDAADAVMGNVDLVQRALVVGDAIGSVPSSAPQVPLARDLGRLQKSARLAPAAAPVTLELDVRTTNGMRRSLLLHRLLALGVPWGTPEEGRGTSGTFRETWRLAWEPELSIRLVERAGYGTTLEAAATAHLVERAERSIGVIDLIGVLDRALLAQLPAAVGPALSGLARRAATDPDIAHLMDAAVPLANAMRYGDVRGTERQSIGVLFDEFVERILAGVVTSFASLDDVAAALAVERLSGVQAALGVIDHPARVRRFPAVLAELATGRGHGLVRGRSTRLLHDGGTWTPIDVERRLSMALSGGTPAATGAAFVEGFLAGSGTVLVHDGELLSVLDTWLSTLTGDAFDSVVALLRRTFGAFEPAERRQIMTLLVSGRVARTEMFGADVDAERAAAALVTVRHLLGLPVHVTTIDRASPDGGISGSGDRSRSDPGRKATPERPRSGEGPQSGEGTQSGDGTRSGDASQMRVVSEHERRRRWRLVLGEGPIDQTDQDQTDQAQPDRAKQDQGANGDDAGGSPTSGDGGPDAVPDGSVLVGDDRRIDAALGALYDQREGERRYGSSGRQRGGGLGRSKPGVVRWLGDIRRYFPTPVVQILQRDAVDRLDLRQLLLEPELLRSVEPDIHLVTLLVELNRLLPDETRATARQVIEQVLADVQARLTDQTRQAVRGSLARSARTRRPRSGDIDWPHTIAANLRNWVPERQAMVPERLVGHGRRQPSLARDVVIAVDQSGSMADSVVYASLFAAVLAQLPTLRTRFVVFDTAVTDLTSYLHDPVEVLFGVQLGGGTDISNALGYCQDQIDRPRQSVLFLVSDLHEGGNPALMHRRVGELVSSGVHVVVLLALSDEGVPAYDHAHAEALTALGTTVLATTPDAFPDVLADALRR